HREGSPHPSRFIRQPSRRLTPSFAFPATAIAKAHPILRVSCDGHREGSPHPSRFLRRPSRRLTPSFAFPATAIAKAPEPPPRPPPPPSPSAPGSLGRSTPFPS